MDASSAARRLDTDHDEVADHPHTTPEVLGELIAVSSGDEFLLELGQLLGSRVIVRPTESVGSLADLLIPTRPQIVAIECTDAAMLEKELRAAAVGPNHLPTVVFVQAATQRDVTPPLRRTGVKMVLPLPLAAEETRAVLMRELENARAAVAARVAAGETFTAAAPQAAAEPAAASTDAGSSRRPLLLAAIAAIVLAGAGAGWYLFGAGTKTAPAAGEPEAAVAGNESSEEEVAPVVGGSVEELLDKARNAMHERRYTEPREDNALLYFRSAIAQDPANAEALDGIERLVALLTARVEQALEENRIEVATQAAGELRSLRGRDARVAALELRVHTRQMAAALDSGNAERIAAALKQAAQSGAVPQPQLNQWRAELTRRQEAERVARLVAQGNDRLRAGQLLEPANANATYFAQQARQLAPADPAAARLARDVLNALLQRTRETGPRTPEGERLLAEARSLGATPAQIAAVQREQPPKSRAQSEADRLLQLFRQRLSEGRLAEPSGDSASSYLQQLRAVAPEHPALDAGMRELAEQLLGQARSAAQAGRTESARTQLALARQFGADAAQARSVEQLIEPEQPVSASGFRVVAHEKLVRTRTTAAEYPEVAQRRRLGGWVIVRFVVNVRGEPESVEAVSAEPKGVFERTGIAAVRQWRYKPWLVNGKPEPVETSVRLRFSPAE